MTIDDLIAHLDNGIRLNDVKELPDDKLKVLERLLHHWQQIAKNELDNRHRPTTMADVARAYLGEDR